VKTHEPEAIPPLFGTPLGVTPLKCRRDLWP